MSQSQATYWTSAEGLDCYGMPLVKRFKNDMMQIQQEYSNSLMEKSEEVSFACEICEESFYDLTELKIHKLGHDNDYDSSSIDGDEDSLSGDDDKKRERLSFSSEEEKKTIKSNDRTEFNNYIKDKLASMVPNDDNNYICPECDFPCRSKAGLRRHMSVHGLENKYHCEFCDFQTPIKNIFQVHIFKHKNMKYLRCDKCPYESTSTDGMKNHKKIHLVVKPFQCPLCPFQTRSQKLALSHTKKHNELGLLTCPQCPFTAREKSTVQKHLTRHGQPATYRCKFCSFGSNKLFHVSLHMDRYHGDQTADDGTKGVPLVCEETPTSSQKKESDNNPKVLPGGLECTDDGVEYNCTRKSSESVSSDSILNQKNQFDDSGLAICSSQDDSSNSEDMQNHHKRKFKKKNSRKEDYFIPFNCDQCSYTSNILSNLIVHKRVHSRERPFECQICFRLFISNSMLMRHFKIHTSEKRYVCNFCGRKFVRSRSLDSHKFKYHNNRPSSKLAQCSKCSYMTNSKKELLEHEERCSSESSSPQFTLKIEEGKCDDEELVWRVFSCKACSFMGANLEDLVKHLETHSVAQTLNQEKKSEYQDQTVPYKRAATHLDDNLKSSLCDTENI